MSDLRKVLAAFKVGQFVTVVDDGSRPDHGNLVLAGQFANVDRIHFMLRHSGGQLYVPMAASRVDALAISMMPSSDAARHKPAYTEPVDARNGVTVGASVVDQVRTITLLADPLCKASDLARPGHVRPIRAHDGGVLVRAAHSEAAVDLARLSGLSPVAVISAILNEDGEMASAAELRDFAEENGIPIISIADLISYRHRTEKLVRHAGGCHLPTDYGTFRVEAFESMVDGTCYIALVKGEIREDTPVLVRVHSGCLTGDVLHSRRCDCRQNLECAMAAVQQSECGVILYIQHHEGRGIGLLNKIKAYALQDSGEDTVEANESLGFPPDIRHYGLGAQVLTSLGVKRIRLMTNNPAKVVGLDGYGLEVVERVPMEIETNEDNVRYLRTKAEKLGHIMP